MSTHHISIRLAIAICLVHMLAGCSYDQVTGPVCDGTPANGIAYWNGCSGSTMEGLQSAGVMYSDTVLDRVLIAGTFADEGKGGSTRRIGVWIEGEERWDFLGGEISGAIYAMVRHRDFIIA